MILLCQ